MTAPRGSFDLELRWDRERERGGEVMVPEPNLQCLHHRTLVSYSDFIYVFVYLHLVQQTWFLLPTPSFSNNTKISEDSSQPSVYKQPFKSLSLSWSKACGHNTLLEWEKREELGPWGTVRVQPRALGLEAGTWCSFLSPRMGRCSLSP